LNHPVLIAKGVQGSEMPYRRYGIACVRVRRCYWIEWPEFFLGEAIEWPEHTDDNEFDGEADRI
jgi:hypothetical protein